MSRPLIVITGTTGSGKSEVGVEVAIRTGAEVVSLDSMAVYRGMDIGTAKPDEATRRGVPHHMIDVVVPSEEMNLHRFIELTEDVLVDMERREVPAVVVGGTTMYLVGLLWGLDDGPPRDDAFRTALVAEREALGVEALHARLAEADPACARAIDPQDYQRIERALEIVASGARPSELRTGWFRGEPRPSRLFVLTWPRPELRRRIEERVDRMLEAGWVDEVRAIRDAGGFSRGAAKALGYREILAWLDGELAEEHLAERIKTRTWQFAKRQLTWLRKLEHAEVITLGEGDTVEGLADRMV